MKRSNIFLAVASCFLAIAGVAATKAHKFGANQGYIVVEEIGYTLTTSCTNDGSNTCKIKYTAAGRRAGSGAYYTALTLPGRANKLLYRLEG